MLSLKNFDTDDQDEKLKLVGMISNSTYLWRWSDSPQIGHLADILCWGHVAFPSLIVQKFKDGILDVKSAEADSFLALWGGLGISLGLVFYGKRVIQWVLRSGSENACHAVVDAYSTVYGTVDD